MSNFKKQPPKCASVNPACSTINLAKEGLSLEERKTRLLVFEKEKYHPISKPKPECQLPVGLTLTPKTAKKIRMCTAEDIKTTCPPPCCNCPNRRPPPTTGEYIRSGVKFGFKSAFLIGVIYTTWDMGLWGSAEDTESIWNSMKKSVFGPDAEMGPPCLDRKLYGATHHWNNAVQHTFVFLSCFGRTLSSYLSPPRKESCDMDQRAKDREDQAKRDPCFSCRDPKKK